MEPGKSNNTKPRKCHDTELAKSDTKPAKGDNTESKKRAKATIQSQEHDDTEPRSATI